MGDSSDAARILGRLGGSARTEAKRKAVRKNGLKGGRRPKPPDDWIPASEDAGDAFPYDASGQAVTR